MSRFFLSASAGFLLGALPGERTLTQVRQFTLPRIILRASPCFFLGALPRVVLCTSPCFFLSALAGFFLRTSSGLFLSALAGFFLRTSSGLFLRTSSGFFLRTSSCLFLSALAGFFLRTSPCFFLRTSSGFFLRTSSGFFLRTPSGFFLRTPSGFFLRTSPGFFLRTPAGFFLRTSSGFFLSTPSGFFLCTSASIVVSLCSFQRCHFGRDQRGARNVGRGRCCRGPRGEAQEAGKERNAQHDGRCSRHFDAPASRRLGAAARNRSRAESAEMRKNKQGGHTPQSGNSNGWRLFCSRAVRPTAPGSSSRLLKYSADTLAAMKAVVIQRQGSPVAENVAFVESYADPDLRPGSVRVRTEAAALNHLDLWVGRGLPGIDLTYPRVSGSDGCGIVEAVGAEVDPSWVGRRVILNAAVPLHDSVHPELAPAAADRSMIGEHVDGTLAEFFVAPVGQILDVGEADPVEAAAFGLTHLTAWRMLVTRARLQPGMTVLITGIGGGVALASLAIARHLGCRTIVTSRHSSKLDLARELGADEVVLDEGTDWSRTVRGLTGRRGVDVCVDSVGKALHLAGLKSLARGGVYVTCGCTTGPDAVTDLARLFWNEQSILGSTMGDMAEFRAVVALFRSRALLPVIDGTYPASEAGEAYRRLESGAQFGKIVVSFAP